MGKLESILGKLTNIARDSLKDDSPLPKSLAFIYLFENPINFEPDKINSNYFDSYFKYLAEVATEDDIYQYSMCLKLAAIELFGDIIYDIDANSFVGDNYLMINEDARALLIHRARFNFNIVKRIKEDKLERLLDLGMSEFFYGIAKRVIPEEYMRDQEHAIRSAAYGYLLEALPKDKKGRSQENDTDCRYGKYKEYKDQISLLIGKRITRNNLSMLAVLAFQYGLSFKTLAKTVAAAIELTEESGIWIKDDVYLQNLYARIAADIISLGDKRHDPAVLHRYANKLFGKDDPINTYKSAGTLAKNSAGH